MFFVNFKSLKKRYYLVLALTVFFACWTLLSQETEQIQRTSEVREAISLESKRIDVKNIKVGQSDYEREPDNQTTQGPEETPKYSIHFVIIADAKAKQKYRLHMETVRCFAEARNYDLIVASQGDLQQSSECDHKRIPIFFLRRHCILAQIMRKYSARDYFLFIDGDSIAFDLERQFPWSDYLSYDLVYYERWWNGEVACLYGLKNTPATREWLLTWAREDDQPYRHRLYLWTL